VNADEGPASRTHLRRLTSFRAFAALAVFTDHVAGRFPSAAAHVADYGFVGVAFFFVLSGFVLAWSFDAARGAAAFYLRRFARIYPSYVVMLVVACLVPLATSAVTLPFFATDALLVQSWLPPKTNPYALNGVSWSLSCEIVFYAVLPLLLPRLLKMTPRRRWALALVYWSLASAVVVGCVISGHGQNDAYTWPPIRFAEFLLGVVAAIEIRRGWRASTRLLTSIGLLGLVGLLAAGDASRRFPAADVGAGALFFAVVVAAAQRDIHRPRGLLAGRWFVYAGQVSFAFYLVHQLVILNLGDHYGFRSWPSIPTLLAAAIVAAVALHHLVERPCERRIRRMTLPNRRRVAESPVPFDG
jgi:peptidoglycan/LPS O-acetylase OafA/YrhL